MILDVQSRDNDSFSLLETIGLEMELPVVLGESSLPPRLPARPVLATPLPYLSSVRSEGRPLSLENAVSSSDNRELVLRGVEFGAVDFLVKPVQIAQLKNIWQHVMRRQRRRSSMQSAGGDEVVGRPASPGQTTYSGASANAGAQAGATLMERLSDTCRPFSDVHDQAPARAGDGGPVPGPTSVRDACRPSERGFVLECMQALSAVAVFGGSGCSILAPIR